MIAYFCKMSAEFIIAPSHAGRKEKYEILLPQLKSLVEGESDLLANLSNIVSALVSTFNFHWVGFYRVKAEELVLGPFQGPVACTRIAYGKGVCGTAWKEGRTLIVPDVELFEGHIACSSLTRSEMVLPVFSQGRVVMVLDIDSIVENDFSEADRAGMQAVVSLVETLNPGRSL